MSILSGLSALGSFAQWGCVRLVSTFILLAGLACAWESANSKVTVLISSETVPAGSTAQIKFSLAAPQAVSSGSLSIDFDPEFFGEVMAASAFSAAGDAQGYATVTGRHVDVRFFSPSGSVGLLKGLPVVTVTVPLLPALREGSKATVLADPDGSPWLDAQGSAYSVAVEPGVQTAGGTLSIREVQPSIGVFPAGTTIRVLGTGFSSATIADIEGASVSSVQFSGPQQMDLTLGAPTEIAGKRIRLRNPDDAAIDFFAAWSGDPLTTLPSDPFENVRPILPLVVRAAAETPDLPRQSGWLTVQNPNSTPVEVAVQRTSVGFVEEQTVLTIPAGAASNLPYEFFYDGTLRVLASAPVRAGMLTRPMLKGMTSSVKVARPLLGFRAKPLQLYVGPQSLDWAWRVGAAKPASKTIGVYTVNDKTPTRFTVSATTIREGIGFRLPRLALRLPVTCTLILQLPSIQPDSLRVSIGEPLA